ncbi:PhzF family phenazine biosynthesis protein [Saccharopolyspora indica]|uniref:PhzF family phenazine biosynthesis protein n=1 Tax=Saccharopolyspora indica TaxID=1229659 RepID=UPI0022EB9EC8|nr:PhzF family phenazine biosynthesis protein [Saccharopolyspora indica]MDA3645712.1 PhzF family phenazine biosynthesis protein [Saccharopolyspora indica]
MTTSIRRPFAQVDVFGSGSCSGNALAVVLAAEGLSDEVMQRFARWTNLSETTFLLPPTRPEADYRVRIFTASEELPFAGHPTLGSCHAWLSQQPGPPAPRIVQECAAGLIELRADDGQYAFAAPPLIRQGPVEEELREQLARGLELAPGQLRDAQWVDNGPGWVAVLLGSSDEVLRAPTPPGTLPPLGVVGPCPPGAAHQFEVRAFFPGGGQMIEDPVTGSLNAGIAQWLIDTDRAPAHYVARQGSVVGADGRVSIDRDEDGTTWVGGTAVTCIQGEVDL